jgi:hypothetical protein
MTTNTSRRALLAGLSVAPVALASALPAMAAPHPDAELFVLIESWQELRRLMYVADEITNAAEDSCRSVTAPEALFAQEEDCELFHNDYSTWYDDERRWYPPNFTGYRYLKSLVELMDRHGRNSPRAERQYPRAAEIVAAADAYDADRKAAERECGYDVAEAESERLSAESRELAVAIVEKQALTIEGVLRKTLLFADIYPGGSHFECPTQALDRMLSNEPVLDRVIAFGLARDLTELAKQAGASV